VTCSGGTLWARYPPCRRTIPPRLREAWSRLRARTFSKAFPQFLIALYYGGLLLGKLLTGHVGGGIALFPAAIAAGFWFFGIVLVRLAAVAPLGRSFWETTGNLWLLFIGYSTWLGLFPPTGSKSAVEWGAWVLVIAGLVAVIIFLPW
jgi:hypothetical protein